MKARAKRLLSIPLAVGLAAAGWGCSDSEPEQAEQRSGLELIEAADHIQEATGSAAVVSTAEELGLVVVAITGDENDPADVVEDTCQAVLDLTEGAPFSFAVILDDGTLRWYGSVTGLERCPPR